MNESQYLYDKYKTRDILEINQDTHIKVMQWLTGQKSRKKSVDLEKVVDRIGKGGEFIRFLDKGVIFIKHDDINRFTSVYPFEYSDSGVVTQSIYISDPKLYNEPSALALLCKLEYSTDVEDRFMENELIVEGTWNGRLATDHMRVEVELGRLHKSVLEEITEALEQEGRISKEMDNTKITHVVAREYFKSVIFAQLLGCIGINAYFALLDKQSLVGKIEQVHTPHASNRTEARRGKRNPFYRYAVKVPIGYHPRHFDLTYLLREWSRSGHKAIRWVRKENAGLLAERSNGKVTDRTRGDYVAIEIPIRPQTCHRSENLIKGRGEEGFKTYKE